MKASKETPMYWFGAGTPAECLLSARRTPADRAVYKDGDKWIIDGLSEEETENVIESWRHENGKIYPIPHNPDDGVALIAMMHPDGQNVGEDYDVSADSLITEIHEDGDYCETCKGRCRILHPNVLRRPLRMFDRTK
jgi:hypothetical protein